MSGTDPDGRSATSQTFVLRPSPPVRGLAISAVAVLVGVVVLVASTEYAWPAALGWLGLAVALAGVGIAVAALVSARRLRSDVTVRAGGITVAGVRGRTTLAWEEIERVAAIEDQLLLVPVGDRPEVMIVSPRGRRDPAYPDLVAAIRQRMDDDRGYHTLT